MHEVLKSTFHVVSIKIYYKYGKYEKLLPVQQVFKSTGAVSIKIFYQGSKYQNLLPVQLVPCIKYQTLLPLQ